MRLTWENIVEEALNSLLFCVSTLNIFWSSIVNNECDKTTQLTGSLWDKLLPITLYGQTLFKFRVWST